MTATPLRNTVTQLLMELCEKLGYCNAGRHASEFQQLAAQGPDEFTDAVLHAEGMDPTSDRQARRAVYAMVAPHMNSMHIAHAVNEFREAANKKQDFAASPSTDSELYEAMADAWWRLEQFGGAGRSAFRALLSDESIHVQRWVATQLLALSDVTGLSLLEEDAARSGIGAFNSQMVLREWRAGRLRPPF